MIIAGLTKPTIAELLKKTGKKLQNRQKINDYKLEEFKKIYLLPNKEISQLLNLRIKQIKDLKSTYIFRYPMLTPYLYTDMQNKNKNKDYIIESNIYLNLPIIVTTMTKIVYQNIKGKQERIKALKEIENLAEIIISKSIVTPPYSVAKLIINTVDPNNNVKKI